MANSLLSSFLALFTGRKRVAPTVTAGSPGYAVDGGYVRSKEKQSALSGTQRWVTYDQAVLNCAIVGAGVRYFLDLVSEPSWCVEPKDESAEAQRIAEEVERILLEEMDIRMRRIVRRTATAPFFGFSVQEWTARKRKDGSIGYAEVAPRPQFTIEQWDVDEHGHVLGMLQKSPQTQQTIYLPRSKCVYMVDDSISDSPEGVGLLRQVIEPVRRLQRYEQLEGYGYEADLRGVPIVRAPLAKLQRMVDEGKLTAAQKSAIEAPVRDFLENHIRGPELGLLLDSAVQRAMDEGASPSSIYEWSVELMQSVASSHEHINTAIMREMNNIAMVLGVEELLLGSGDTGTYALSKNKSSMLLRRVQSCLNDVQETYERDLVRPLFLMNGWDLELMPKVYPESVRQEDVETVYSALEALARSGVPMLPGDPAVDAVRSRVGLPPMPEEAVDFATEGILAEREAAAAAAKPDADTDEEAREGEGGGREPKETEEKEE